MRVLELLQHLQFIVDHTLISTDVLLQDNLDRNLLAIGCFRLPDDTVCACAERATEFVEGPRRGVRSE